MRQTIRLTESELRQLIVNEVKSALNEGLFDIFKKKEEPSTTNIVKPEKPYHIYTVQELEWLYKNQTNLSPIQHKVLSAALWVRARQANYHGFAKKWPNIMVKDGNVYYWKNGELTRI